MLTGRAKESKWYCWGTISEQGTLSSPQHEAWCPFSGLETSTGLQGSWEPPTLLFPLFKAAQYSSPQ